MDFYKLAVRMAENSHNMKTLAAVVGMNQAELIEELCQGRHMKVAIATKIKNALWLSKEETKAIFFPA
jgi:hypothetical protein